MDGWMERNEAKKLKKKKLSKRRRKFTGTRDKK